ncbi:[Pyruvate dehydrogenase (acetyl-transferring)] kinase isozyme 2 [Coemansia sp. RSA 2523]|nr:[Pyruvate dehydrogenase (acetyl-transferring)] kinase isozyme 2 [Coemansia sp. RSA 1591]KAJ1756260.1 [Pyruvate dehydrogenase (acetyl-transferring)] kinase isozyme 2 [Coemansia sp. RSA 1752]KAJ1775791.1 [Pyruvate dehydrogenase (acetyl-transferring)] kinase isozyme 2 [Coemansia sp. RSA 1824]KAJ1783357.1 [Pyruvate dehydrogenase (acetyl-transferring)] kinase isozyme 2 [Coemansia sp. RSA 1938]KAJ1784223.1 [Pyruvate dehydrogenase (acetyl-transferring)] kinase isozyme 2 [Coemansia sp. RSA 2167]KAJ
MPGICKELATKIAHFARFPQTGVSLRQMVEFGQNPSQGTLLRAAQFLHDELPIRLAHRVVELDSLPDNLNQMPSVLRVKRMYIDSFNELVNFPRVSDRIKDAVKGATVHANAERRHLPESNTNPAVSDMPRVASSHWIPPIQHRYHYEVKPAELPVEVTEYNRSFVKSLERIKRRHDPVVTTLAHGVVEYKQLQKTNRIDASVQHFLDRFYLSRIGIRMLIGQQIELNQQRRDPNFVGVICTNTNVAQVVQEAIDNARYICGDYYVLMNTPAIELHCPKDLAFMYVPSHLHHMVFELLKNSLRAVIELYGDEAEKYPPIKVVVAEGNEDITIKVSDEGGGIPRSAMEQVWTYMYTTAQTPMLDPEFNQSDFKAPLAGFGYGLPLSRLYARYFGGDLKLISMEGYGTDAYLHLSRLSDNEEPLA